MEHKIISRLFLLIIFIISIQSLTNYKNAAESEPLTPLELQEFERISSPVMSPDGKYVVYSVKKWDHSTKKSYTNLQITEISTKKRGFITPAVDGQSDSNPTFSISFPYFLFFQRKGKILYIPFPPDEINMDVTEDKSETLAEYNITISEYKLKRDAFVFSADVYFDCETIECSANKIKKETKDYQTYTSLHMFHWDEWLIEGKGSHLFYQKFKLVDNKFELIDKPKDVTQGMELNTPPLFTSNQNYDISNDGNLVAFSAHIRNHEESWSTSWHTYYVNPSTMSKPHMITTHTDARTQQPKFSLDNTKIAYLAMKVPMLESENLHFEVYNILTNDIIIIDDVLDLSVSDYFWENDHLLYFQATSLGLNNIYTVDIKIPTKPEFKKVDTNTTKESFDLPIKALKNRNIKLAVKTGYDYPEKIVKFPDGEVIVDTNEDKVKNKELPEPVSFQFQGGYNDTVQGWIMKPINFEDGKKYPVVLLIHGGPENSWTTSWRYTWNPSMYAQQGYVVVMINIHGSVGVTSDFRDAVRNDWGGVPYEDLITGMNYVFDNYNFVDKEKVCAAGGSYGGYMINWINGHTDMFKCLVNHDGIFSVISEFYGTDELWFQKAEFCPKDKTGCNPFDGKAIREGYERNNPERFVKNWKTPTLFIHGGKDLRVPLTEGLQAFTALQLQGIDSQFLYYPLENHWTLDPPNQIKWCESVFSWLEKYHK
jgi:acylaminoacyl-peptidase